MTGDIDSTFPAGLMHLVDRQSDLFHQHGGVVTAVHFDSLEEMTVDEFITRVVPTLKGDKEHITVIKDSTKEQVLRILGDNVARYHIKDIQRAEQNWRLTAQDAEAKLKAQEQPSQDHQLRR